MVEKSDQELLGLSIDQAVASIKRGGIVAFPTETYYGLAVDPESPAAVNSLFRIKKRQTNKPLLLLIENREQLQWVTEQVPPEFLPLMDKYWPGPLTLVFQAKHEICQQLTGNTGTIGVRISSHPIASELVKRVGKPITATSANISGHPPACTAKEVRNMFGNSLSHIIDGGQTAAGLCSTVLGCHAGKYILLRQGQIHLPIDPFNTATISHSF